MKPQITVTRRALTGEAVHKVFRRCALAAVGACFCSVITVGVLANSSATRSSSPVTVPPSPVAGADRPVPDHWRGLLDTKPDYRAAHARTVDRLFEELMRWTPPCFSASADTSMPGRC